MKKAKESPAVDAQFVEPKQALQVVSSQPMSIGPDFAPALTIAQAMDRYNQMLEFIKGQMVEGKDFGTIGDVEKKTLLKPGAEKLLTFFGFKPKIYPIAEIMDWTGKDHGGEPLFYFSYRTDVFKQILAPNGNLEMTLIVSLDRSNNSWESRYRFRWVDETEAKFLGYKIGDLPKRASKIVEFRFAVEKAETEGKYGKPETYWKMWEEAIADGRAVAIKKETRKKKKYAAYELDSTVYRITNPNIFDVINTIQGVAQKRSFVGATVIACNASEFFTTDLEDLEELEIGSGLEPNEENEETGEDTEEQDEERSSTRKVTKKAAKEPKPEQTQTKLSTKQIAAMQESVKDQLVAMKQSGFFESWDDAFTTIATYLVSREENPLDEVGITRVTEIPDDELGRVLEFLAKQHADWKAEQSRPATKKTTKKVTGTKKLSTKKVATKKGKK